MFSWLKKLFGKKSDSKPEEAVDREPVKKVTLSDVQVGQFIQLKDEQAIEDSIKAGSIEGIRYEVVRRCVIKERGGLCEWVALYLEEDEEELVLITRTVDGESVSIVYFDAPEVPNGRVRLDWLERGFDFLWEGDSESCFDLDYVKSINAPLENAKGDLQEVEFDQKIQPFYGECEDSFVTVVEYGATEEFVNPDIIVLEIGDDKDEGGMVSMYVGSPVDENDVEIY